MRSEDVVAAFGPGPIEVADRLEASDMSGTQAALQASARTLLLLQSISVASQPAAAASPQCASRPCRLSALARTCRASRLLIALLLELVIGFEPVRLHVDIAHLDMLGQNDGDGRRLVTQLAAVLECEPHRIGMRHAALDRLADGGVKLGGAEFSMRASRKKRKKIWRE